MIQKSKLKLPPDRTVLLMGEIDSKKIRILMKKILFQLDTTPGDIYLLINSVGGEEGAATMMYETFKKCLSNKLITIAAGEVSSSATIIFCAGDERMAYKNSNFFVHAGFDESATQMHEFKSVYKLNKIQLRNLSKIYATNSNLSWVKWQELILKSKTFSSKEMLKTGLISKIL